MYKFVSITIFFINICDIITNFLNFLAYENEDFLCIGYFGSTLLLQQ